jgi:NitT/TauT family transport system ATP-binding protein
MSSIAARGVSMVFDTRGGAVRALDDVTVEIPDAHFACIVGASGCGKSTLLNIMAGLIRPTEGTIEVGRRGVAGPGADRGMVFQSYTLFPWLRVRENIEFGPSLKDVANDERRRIADALLEEMGLVEFAHAYPRELSGGMKQRVAIARALANDPDVLLMDEPFGALDAQTRVVMQENLLKIWNEFGTTVIFVTHDVDEAIFLADRVLIMSASPGRIIADLTVELPRPRMPEMTADLAFLELKKQCIAYIRAESVKAFEQQNR